MHILTVMDYTTEPEVTMCKAWIYFTKRFNPYARITIFHTKNIDKIRLFASRYTSVYFDALVISPRVRNITGGYTHHPVQELQLSVWAQTEKLGIKKYIYADSDAFILDSLNEWWDHIDDKPYIGIKERRLPDGTVLFNAGVYSYSSRNGFITRDKLLEQYRRDNKKIRFPAGQQGLLTAYFQHIHYDAASEFVGHEYNTLTRFCNVRRVDDNDVIVYSGRYPIRNIISRLVRGGEKEWSADWVGWNKPRRVKILHAFGAEYKFWKLPECEALWAYCKKITHS